MARSPSPSGCCKSASQPPPRAPARPRPSPNRVRSQRGWRRTDPPSVRTPRAGQSPWRFGHFLPTRGQHGPGSPKRAASRPAASIAFVSVLDQTSSIEAATSGATNIRIRSTPHPQSHPQLRPTLTGRSPNRSSHPGHDRQRIATGAVLQHTRRHLAGTRTAPGSGERAPRGRRRPGARQMATALVGKHRFEKLIANGAPALRARRTSANTSNGRCRY